jgi:ribonuclease VapC
MVVDSSALVAVLFDEPGCERILEVLSREPRSVVGAPTALETSMIVADRLGPNGVDGLRRTLRALRITVEPFGTRESRVAVRAFLKYGKGRHRARLNFGDCMSYAVAKTRRQRLLYKGDDFSHTDVEPAL